VKHILLLLTVGAFAMPAFAQDAPEGDMPCSDFVTMAPADQERAFTAVQPEPNDPDLDAVLATCSENPDMSLEEAVEQAPRD
jgi:hypothetical protein